MASAACCTPAPPSEHTSKGEEGTIGGLNAYLNKPASAKAAIILVSDVFGYDPPLLRKLADETAAKGFYVVVPDFFKGDPYVPKDPANPFASFGPWLSVHHPTASFAVAKTIVKELKEQGFESVGASGFCWGAPVAISLGSDTSLAKSVVILHPSLTSVDDIKGVKSSIAVLGSELDDFTPPALVGEYKKVLDSKPEITSFVKIFPGQTHGWSIRYDVKDSHQVKGAHEAHQDMIEFYKKTL